MLVIREENRLDDLLSWEIFSWRSEREREEDEEEMMTAWPKPNGGFF
jgi:hypothetical protein